VNGTLNYTNAEALPIPVYTGGQQWGVVWWRYTVVNLHRNLQNEWM